MISKVTATTVVHAPLREVYDQWTQFEEFPTFMSSVAHIEQTSDASTHWRVEIGGVEHEFDAEITEQIPDSWIRWQSLGETKHTGEVEFEAVPDGTRVTLTMGWVPEGFVEKVGAALNIDERAAERDLANFKELMERRGTASGEWRGSINDAKEK